jgi:single-strand DNA-binding protein
MSMATVTFTGNIGKYHGLKFGQDGKPRTSFSVAETAREKNQQGQWEDAGTTWFNVTLFGAAAESLDAAIPDGKGRIMVTGRMKTREYEHNGEKRESLDVVAEAVALVPRSERPATVPASDPWAAQQDSVPF